MIHPLHWLMQGYQWLANSRQKFWLVVVLLVLIHIFLVGAIALFFPPNEASIILRYNVYFGIDILASWWQIYLLPLLSIIFLVGNIFFAKRFLVRGEWLLSILLLLGSGVITFGLAVALAAIVFINY